MSCPMNLYTRPIANFRFEGDKNGTCAARKVQFCIENTYYVSAIKSSLSMRYWCGNVTYIEQI